MLDMMNMQWNAEKKRPKFVIACKEKKYGTNFIYFLTIMNTNKYYTFSLHSDQFMKLSFAKL